MVAALRLRGLGGSRSALIAGIPSLAMDYSRAEIEMRQPNSALQKNWDPKGPKKFRLLQLSCSSFYVAWACVLQAYQSQLGLSTFLQIPR